MLFLFSFRGPQWVISASLAASIGLVQAASAQSLDPAAPIAPGSFKEHGAVMAHGVSVWTDQGRVFAGGPDYEAEVTAAQMHFVPFLGDQAEELPRWSFRFGALRRGEQELPTLREDAPVETDAKGRTIRVRRSGVVVEVFRAGPHGLEITYEIQRPLPGRGDLVVEGEVSTNLQLVRSEATGAAWHHRSDGATGVALGGVFGVDANGWKVRGQLRVDGDRIAMRLPESFLKAAVWPVVLDPLVSTDLPGSSADPGINDKEPAMAYLDTANQYLATYIRDVSAGVRVVRAQRLDGDTGALVGGFLSVTGAFLPSGYATAPAVAGNSSSNSFLVAWAQASNIASSPELQCRIVRPDGTLSSTIYSLPSNLSSLAFDPAVLGTSLPAGGAWTVAFSNLGNAGGLGLAAVTLVEDSQGQPVEVTNSFTGLGNNLRFTPALAGVDPVVGLGILVGVNGSGGQQPAPSSLSLALLGSGSQVPNQSALIAGTMGGFEHPDIAGDGSRLHVVFSREESVGGGPRDILLQELTVGAATGISLIGAPKVIAGTPGLDEHSPSIMRTASKLVITWTAELPGGPAFDAEVRMLSLLPDGCVVCSPVDVAGSGPRERNHQAVLASRFEAGLVGDEQGLVAYASTDNFFPLASEVRVARYRSFGEVPNTQVLPAGCGAAMQQVPSADVGRLGNTASGVALVGAPLTANFAILRAAVPQPFFGCGSCQTLNPFGLAFELGIPVVGGTASYDGPVPCNTNLLGLQLDFQWLVFNTGVTPCGLVSGLSLTDVLRITVAR